MFQPRRGGPGRVLSCRYDFPVQAAVFEVAVIGDGRSTVQVDFVDEVLHGAVLLALFDHQELAMADGSDVAQFGGAGVLVAPIDGIGIHGRRFRSRVEFDDTRVFGRLGPFSRRRRGTLDEGEDMARSSMVRPSLPRLGTRLAGCGAGPCRDRIFPGYCMAVGLDDERSIFVTDPEITVFVDSQASVSRPFVSVPKSFIWKFKAISFVEPVKPAGKGLPVMALPWTFKGMDAVMSARP